MCVTTDTLVLIRLHKKADLLETKVYGIKDGKVYANKNILWSGKEWTTQ